MYTEVLSIKSQKECLLRVPLGESDQLQASSFHIQYSGIRGVVVKQCEYGQRRYGYHVVASGSSPSRLRLQLRPCTRRH